MQGQNENLLPEASGGESTPPRPSRRVQNPISDVLRLRRRVRLGVYAAILASEPFYYFVIGYSPVQMLAGLLVGLSIAFVAIEAAFGQMIKLRKRSAYPNVLLVELGNIPEIGEAAEYGLQVIGQLIDVPRSAIALLGSDGSMRLAAVNGLDWRCGQEILDRSGKEAGEAISKLQPLSLGLEPGQEFHQAFGLIGEGIGRIVFAPVIALQQPIGVMILAAGTRSQDVADAQLLTSIGIALGLSLESLRQKAELREGQERLRTVVNGAPLVMFALDQDGAFTLIDGKAAERLGARSEELLGRSIFEIQAGHQELLDDVKRALGGEEVTTVTRIAGVDLEARLTPLADARGDVAGVIGIATDITERRRAEQALRENEERLRTVVSNLPVVLSSIDREGTFTLSDGKGLAALGLESGQIVGLNVRDVYKDVPQIQDNIARALAGDVVVETVEVGDLSWDTIYSPVRDEAGTVAGVIGVASDVTERRRADQALRESEERLRRVVSSVPVVLFAVDAEGILTLAEGRGLQALGLTGEMMVGRSGYDLFPNASEQMRQIHDRARAGESATLVVNVGGLFWETSFGPIRDAEGNFAGLIGVGADVSERHLAEQALRASEERYRELVENASDGIFVTTLDNRILSVNAAYQDILGYSPAELIGTDAAAVIAPEYRKLADEMTARKAAGAERTTRYEMDLVRKDGTQVSVEINSWLGFADGAPAAVHGIVRDISARRRHEEELRLSEERFRELFDNASDIVYTHDLTGKFTSINHAAERITGYSREEAVGLNIATIVAPDHLQSAMEMIRNKVQGSGDTTYEIDIITKDGRRLPLEVSTRLIVRDGRPVGVQGIARDINERRRAEEALRESEELYRTLVETSPDAVFLVGADSCIAKANLPAAILLGFEDPAQLEQANSREFLTDAERTRLVEELQDTASDGVVRNVRHNLVRRDGSTVPCEMSVTALPDADGVTRGYVCVARDISEQLRAEEALRRSEKSARLLYRLTDVLAAADNVQQIYEPALQALQEMTGADRVSVLVFDGQGVMRFRAWKGLSSRYRKAVEGHSPWTPEDRDPHPITVGDVLSDPDMAPLGKTLAAEGIRALAFIPLVQQGQLLGKFMVYYDSPHEFGEEELRSARTVAGHVASALLRTQAEEALRESEERHRELVENSTEIIYTLDEAARITYISPAVTRVGGYAVEDLIGQSSVMFIHPDDQANIALSFQRVMAGDLEPSEYRLRRKDGDYVWVQSASRPIYEDGKIVGVRGMLVDISERKQAEETLHALVEGTASATGDEFFRSLVHHLAKALNTRYAIVGQLLQNGHTSARTHAVWVGNDFGEDFEYDLAGTPCKDVLTQDIAYYPQGIQQQFPDDELAKDMGIESYLGAPVYDSAGRPLGILAVMDQRPMTMNSDAMSILKIFAARAGVELERKLAEEALRRSEERYRNLVDTAQDVIYTLGIDAALTSLNPAFEAVTGHKREDWLGKNFAPLVHPDDVNLAFDLFRKVLAGEGVSYELRIRRASGDYLVGEFTSTPLVEDGVLKGVFGIARDITERKKAEATIRQLAYHDALTGLPNRSLFEDRLSVALAQAHRSRQMLAIMFLDLDRFKIVNDTLGHGGGDKLLKAVAEDLKAIVREGDTVARVGGDEFTVLLPGIEQSGDVAEVAQRILEVLRGPRLIDGQEFAVSTSVGITVYPQDGIDVETMMRNADTAMYRAKERGRDNYQMYAPSMNATVVQRLTLENDLRHALERSELRVYYQPIADTASGQMIATEALVRWQHPGRGLVVPDEFIPFAEETGLIVPIGEWVLREAMLQNRAWQKAGHAALKVTVNMSARQLQQDGLAPTIERLLGDTGLAAEHLQIEITEGAVMKNVDYIVAMLHQLREMGVGVSLDDFGTGYSSLSYLKRFPIDSVKIDRSFVRDIATDPNDAAIVTTVIDMARNLNLKVIAEGVETAEQLSFLRRRGCDAYQGYLISRPVEASAITSMLERGRRPRARVTRLRSA